MQTLTPVIKVLYYSDFADMEYNFGVTPY